MNELSPSLNRFLAEMEYPAFKDDLIREGSRDGLPDGDMRALDALPDGCYRARRQVRLALRATAAERALVAA